MTKPVVVVTDLDGALIHGASSSDTEDGAVVHVDRTNYIHTGVIAAISSLRAMGVTHVVCTTRRLATYSDAGLLIAPDFAVIESGVIITNQSGEIDNDWLLHFESALGPPDDVLEQRRDRGWFWDYAREVAHAVSAIDGVDIVTEGYYGSFRLHIPHSAEYESPLKLLSECGIPMSSNCSYVLDSRWGTVFAVPQGIDKWTAVRHILCRQHLENADIVGLGDDYSDLPFLIHSAHAFVMPHAPRLLIKQVSEKTDVTVLKRDCHMGSLEFFEDLSELLRERG